MKQIKLACAIITCCVFINNVVKAQGKVPFMTFYLSEMQSTNKGADGKWSDWKSEKNLKTIVLDYYLADINNIDPADRKVTLYYFKNKKQVENFSYESTDSKEEKGNNILILKGAKNSSGKSCTIEIKRSIDRSDPRIAKIVVVDINYDDAAIEYSGITL